MSKEQLTREAALLIFSTPPPRQCSRLQNLSEREWKKLLRWLDISGLSLYFLERMMELQRSDSLPSDIRAQLQQNLLDNTERTHGMIAESIAIQQEFQIACLSYATLKGFSLWPYSVPKLELRSQFDLDFLITEEDLPKAREILERKGYILFDVSGRSWEFKTSAEPGAFLKDLYKDSPFRSVELHIEANSSGRPAQLGRIEKREFYGISMPTLSPVDLFLGHGLHVYHHLCGEFSRASHLLEFRRHVLFRHDDSVFWVELQSMAQGNHRASLGLGMVILLITRVMGDFAPEALTGWTVDRLPLPARLWVELYGCSAVFQSLPGSKLHLLLQRELASSSGPAKRSLRQVFLPTRVPPAFKWVAKNETLPMRSRRHRRQLHFIFLRLRFHIAEGLRYVLESYRWRQHMNRLAR